MFRRLLIILTLSYGFPLWAKEQPFAEIDMPGKSSAPVMHADHTKGLVAEDEEHSSVQMVPVKTMTPLSWSEKLRSLGPLKVLLMYEASTGDNHFVLASLLDQIDFEKGATWLSVMLDNLDFDRDLSHERMLYKQKEERLNSAEAGLWNRLVSKMKEDIATWWS